MRWNLLAILLLKSWSNGSRGTCLQSQTSASAALPPLCFFPSHCHCRQNLLTICSLKTYSVSDLFQILMNRQVDFWGLLCKNKSKNDENKSQNSGKYLDKKFSFQNLYKSWRKYWTKFKSIKILLKTREEKKPVCMSFVDSKQFQKVTWRVTWITSMTSRLQNTNLHATYVITPLRLQSMGGIPMRLLRFDLCYRRFCGSSQGSCPQESFVSLSKVWFQSQEKGLLEKSHSTRVHDVKT